MILHFSNNCGRKRRHRSVSASCYRITERLGDGSQLIEFDAGAGKTYEVQYSADTVTWLQRDGHLQAA